MQLPLLVMLLTLGLTAHADDDSACTIAVRTLQPASIFSASAACAASQPAFCAALDHLDTAGFEPIALLLEAGATSPPALQMSIALNACGVDYPALHDRQCQKAYRYEEVDFILRHCPDEAWSLARAQCERNLDSISPRYFGLCSHFGRPVPR